MILSDKEILMEIRSGRLRFDPTIEDGQISPSSIDLHLSDQFTIFTRNAPGVETVIDLEKVEDLEKTLEPFGTKKVLAAGESLTLNPGDFVLGFTSTTTTGCLVG